MCCRSRVYPVPVEWPLILEVAGFKQDGNSWQRQVENTSIVVRNDVAETLSFWLNPSIGSHTAGDHERVKVVAAIMFKVLMTLAEQDPLVLASVDGRENLRKALKDAVNNVLTIKEGFGGIEEVFFTSFVTQ